MQKNTDQETSLLQYSRIECEKVSAWLKIRKPSSAIDLTEKLASPSVKYRLACCYSYLTLGPKFLYFLLAFF